MAVVLSDPAFTDELGNEISNVDLTLIGGTDTAPRQIFTKQLQLRVDKEPEDVVSFSVNSSSKGNITISNDGLLTYHGTTAFNGSDTVAIGLLRDGVEVDTLSVNVTGYPVSTVDLDNSNKLVFFNNVHLPHGVDTITIGETINHTVTVQNVGGKNVYFIDGEQQPDLNLQTGNTYVFDVSAVNVGHPFKFSTTADGVHGQGVEFTDGVTPDNGLLTIIVGDTTPNLEYYCHLHPGMGGLTNTVHKTTIAWDDVRITLDDDTHFDINQDVEFSAINMA